jgi:hypothetical protein
MAGIIYVTLQIMYLYQVNILLTYLIKTIQNG